MLDGFIGVSEAEPNETEWNRMEPNGTEWNRMEPNETEWNRMEAKMKSTIPTSNGQCLIQFME
jgi:hypothetical protein